MPNTKPTAIVLAYSHLASDPRVHRQLEWLKDDFHLVAIGRSAPKIPDVTFHAVDVRPNPLPDKLIAATLLVTRQVERFYWHHGHHRAAVQAVADLKPDVVIANDIEAVPAALRIAKGAPVVFDGHEFSPREFEDVWYWNLLVRPYVEKLCRLMLPRVAASMTVCQGIAEAYRPYGIDPVVVTNAAALVNLPVRPTDPQRIRLIHHGVPLPSRKLETMIDMMQHVDERYSLDLMLLGDNAYLESLKVRAQGMANVRFVPPVPFQEIVPFTASYDMGVFLLPPTNFNYAMALPNKFFEFAQARLAIAIGPSPEMVRFVEKYGCGVVAPDFEPQSLAARLNVLTAEQIDQYKRQAAVMAQAENAGTNGEIFRSVIRKVLS